MRNPFHKPRPNPKRAEPRRVRGRVRLKGEDMTELRRQAFERSGGFCEAWKPLKMMQLKHKLEYRCNYPITWETMELMHKKHGPRKNDTLADVIAGCKECHRNEHNAGGKPVPRKPGRPMNQTEALAYWKGTDCFCGKEKKREMSSFGTECILKLPGQLRFDVLNTTGEDYLKAMAEAEKFLLAWKPEEERTAS